MGSYLPIVAAMARRRPGTLFPIEVDILESGLALQASEGSFYGFALAKHLSSRDGSALTAHGTLYKALSRMAESGILEASWEDPDRAESEGRPRRRLYTVTAEGARAFATAQAATSRPVAHAPRITQTVATFA